MTTVSYSIPNISCNHCVHTMQTEIAELTGVKSVLADINTKIAKISFEPPATEEIIKKQLAEINYPAENI